MLQEPTDFSEQCLFRGAKLHQNMLTFILTQLNVWSNTRSTRLAISVPWPLLSPSPPLFPTPSLPRPPRPAGLTNRYHSIGSSNSCSVSALCQSPCKVLGHRDEDVLWSSLRPGTHVSHKCRGFSAVVPETLLGDLYYFHKNIDSVCPFYSQFSMCVQWNFPEAAWYVISQHIEMDMRIQLSLKSDF